ncbi:MAG: hypothetical protein OHK0039_33990 [Bacteroidia bacterium]
MKSLILTLFVVCCTTMHPLVAQRAARYDGYQIAKVQSSGNAARYKMTFEGVSFFIDLRLQQAEVQIRFVDTKAETILGKGKVVVQNGRLRLVIEQDKMGLIIPWVFAFERVKRQEQRLLMAAYEEEQESACEQDCYEQYLETDNVASNAYFKKKIKGGQKPSEWSSTYEVSVDRIMAYEDCVEACMAADQK